MTKIDLLLPLLLLVVFVHAQSFIADPVIDGMRDTLPYTIHAAQQVGTTFGSA